MKKAIQLSLGGIFFALCMATTPSVHTSRGGYQTLTLGHTRQKQPLEVLHFGFELSLEQSKELVFIFGGFHGDELMAEPVVSRFCEHLKTDRSLYTDRKIFCMAAVNPDGVKARSRLNSSGVDLNRNFPTHNFVPNYMPGSRYFSGPRPLSEIESRAVHDFLSPYVSQAKSKMKILSVHGPLAMNNYNGPANGLALAMKKHNRLPVKADVGYPTPGSFGTYYGDELQIPVVTLETRNVDAHTAWNNHYKALLAFVLHPLSTPE